MKAVTEAAIVLDQMPEVTIHDITAKRRAWHAAQQTAGHHKDELRANLFTGAFFTIKTMHAVTEMPPASVAESPPPQLVLEKETGPTTFPSLDL